MVSKLLKIVILVPALIILITIVIINARIHYHPEIRIAGQDTVNTDVLKELRGLKSALDSNADLEMQKIYPEGYLFINALYGLAWCNFIREHPDSEFLNEGLAEIQKTWNKINAPLGRAPFDQDLPLPYGAFYTGWSTYLLGKKLTIEHDEQRDKNELIIFRQRCKLIAAALEDNVYPASYHGGVWPADVVVCATSLALHDKLFSPEYGDLIKDWIFNVKSNLDTRGLIPHSINSVTRQPLEGARGSSMGLMLIFMREIDKAFGEQQFQIYKSTFHDSILGLSAIREYAKDENYQGDVDSGPVIFEIGSAATIVGMQTSALYEDDETGMKIRNALEAVAFPTETNERKVYLFGLMPMADAFITWGHSVQSVSAGNSPYFLAFHLYSALAMAIILILLLLLWKWNI